MIKIAICDDNREDIELAKIRLNEISRGLQCDFEIYEFNYRKLPNSKNSQGYL